jgi:exopolysaccharide biosynthesis polyprenyl glycosylphosphotransferase
VTTTVGSLRSRRLRAFPVRAAQIVTPPLPAPVPRSAAPLARRRRLEARHRGRILATDAVILLGSTLLAASAPAAGAPAGATIRAALVTTLVWWACLTLGRSRDPLVPLREELRRLLIATGAAFGALAIVAVLTDARPLATQLAIAAPLGLIVAAGSRVVWCRRLAARLRAGEHLSRIVAVGRPADLETAGPVLERLGRSGCLIAGSVVFHDVHTGERAPEGPATDALAAQVADAAARLGADTVFVAGAPAADAGFARRLTWALEGTASDVVVWGGFTGVARARMSLHSAYDAPLVRVRVPVYDDARRLGKRAFDIVVSSLALIPIAVLALPIALAIKWDSPGPVLFHQERIGEGGRPFRMVKFRSMTATAERDLAALAAANQADGPLFKLREDPRVTRVGRILRRYSLDELPQFWNVLVGDMSVVGPRPPLPREAAAYDSAVTRRLYVRPGITGPWQVGGRSDLSWEQSVGLDLHYVENWSIPGDLALMWRTVAVMVRPKGAY